MACINIKTRIALKFAELIRNDRSDTIDNIKKITETIYNEFSEQTDKTELLLQLNSLFRLPAIKLKAIHSIRLEDIIPTTKIEEIKENIAKLGTSKQIPKINTELDTWFGISRVREDMLSEFNAEILHNFFIDIEGGWEATSDTDGTVSLLNYKARLFKDLLEYYNKINSDNPITVNKPLYDGNGNLNLLPTDVLNRIQNLFKEPLVLLLDVLREENKEKVDAYKKSFIFKNFDYLILHLFGGIINIAKRLRGVDSSNKNKYYLLDNTDVNATGWGDKEKTPEQVMNLILLKLLTTFKKYNYRTGQPRSGEYLTKNDFLTAIASIKNLIYSLTARTVKIRDILEGSAIENKYNQELYVLNITKDNTLWELGALIRTNGEIVLPMIFDMLSVKKTRQAWLEKFKKVSYFPLDVIYSLNKILFDKNTNSLFKLANNKRGGKADKYYSMFISLLDMTSPNNVVNVTKEKGRFAEKFVFLSAAHLHSRLLQRAINAALSEPLFGIDVNIETSTNENGNKEYIISKNVGDEVIFKASYTPNEEDAFKLLELNKNSETVWNELSLFYSTIILGIDFNNVEFRNNINSEYLAKTHERLLLIAIPMFCKHLDMQNYKFTSDSELRDYLNENYHKNERPKVTFPYTKYIDFFSDGRLADFNRIVAIDFAVKGRLLKSTLRGLDGNMFSSLSITNGATEVIVGWYERAVRLSYPTSGYSIFLNYLGSEKLRELGTPDLNKKATRSTFNENMYIRLALHYLDARMKGETKVIYGVTSDKEDVGVKVFSVPEFIKKTGERADSAFIRKRFPDLVSELRESYEIVQKAIAYDYNEINKEVKRLLSSTYMQKFNNEHDPSGLLQISNFDIFGLAKKYKILATDLYLKPLNAFEGINKAENNASELFFELISMINNFRQIEGRSRLDIVNNVHYSIVKGQLFLNRLVDQMIYRFGYGYEDFIADRNMRFLQSLLNEHFQLRVKLKEDNNISGYARDSFAILGKIKVGDVIENDWISRDGTLVLYKYRSIDPVIDKETGEEVQDRWHRGKGAKKLSELRDPNNPELGLKYEIRINPVLEEFNELQFLLTQQYNNSSMGSYVFSAAKRAAALDTRIKKNVDIIENIKMIDYTKRNVAQSSTVNLYLLNSFNGIGSELNIAYFLDVEAPADTIYGRSAFVKVHDGGIFTEAVTHLLLEGMSNRPFNTTDKPLFTGLAPDMAGWIVKCASYAHTNALMRQSPFRLNMEKKALSTFKFGVVDVTKNMYNESIDYGDIYIKSEDKYYKVTFNHAEEPNMYNVKYTRVNSRGKTVTNEGIETSIDSEIETIRQQLRIETNWDLYLLFGGTDSCSFDSHGELELSEASLQKMVTAVNEVARAKRNEFGIEFDLKKTSRITQAHVDLPLKRALISYMIPEGACKKGFTNPNPMSAYTLEGFLNTTKQKIIQAGRLLDPTHEVDQSEVSLMTLVIAGLSSSFTIKEAGWIYDALGELSELTNKPFIEALASENLQAFEDLIATLTVKALVREKRDLSLKQLVLPIINKYQSDPNYKITYNELKTYISFDEPSVFNYVISLISSTLSNSSIRQKFTGTLSVLNPSYGIQKTYDLKTSRGVERGHKLSDATDISQLIIEPKKVDLIEFGRTYKAHGKNFETNYITVDSYSAYEKLRLYQNRGADIYDYVYEELEPFHPTFSDIYKINTENGVEFIRDTSSLNHSRIINAIKMGRAKKIHIFGQDLKSYNIKFRDIANIPTQYQIWDLKIVLLAFKDKKNKKLREQMQTLLAQITDGTVAEIEVRDFSTYKKDFILTQVKDNEHIYTKDSTVESVEIINNELQTRILDKDLLIAVGDDSNGNLLSKEITTLDSEEIRIWNELVEDGKAIVTDTNRYNYVNSARYKKIKIDPKSIKIENYLAILPSVYKSLLGLPDNVSVAEILNDPNWFFKRSIKNLQLNLLSPNFYSYALIRNNGNHVYITSEPPKGVRAEKTDFIVEEKNGVKHILQVDVHLNIIRSVSSVEDLIYDVAGKTVIHTNNPEWYITNTKYDLVLKGNHSNATYDELISENLLNAETLNAEMLAIVESGDYDITTGELKKLKKSSVKLWVSFKKSLETLVARIPAQSMSSFMTMDIVDFTDGANNAYVNHMQIFLQGSDYDVDKATFLQYSLDKSGKFIGWSPFFDISSESTFALSLKLPVPKVNKVIRVLDKHPDISGIDTILQKHKITYTKKKDRFRVILNNNLIQFLSDPNLPEFVSSETYAKFKDLIDIYNLHHSYLLKQNTEDASDALRNFVVHWSSYISKTPVNLLRSTIPIDDASEPLKEAASNTSIALQFKRFLNLPGDEASKPKDLNTVMTGKDGVGVAASIGVKTYNALLYYYTNKIKELQSSEDWKDAENWKGIIKEIDFLGETYGLLSSVDLDINKVPESIKPLVLKSQVQYDTRNAVNAWVSLAVDNAKELKLGELNAYPDFMGMYLFAAYMGIPIEKAAPVLTSRAAKILLLYMTDDVISGLVGMRSPTMVMRKLKEIPEFRNFDVLFTKSDLEALSESGDEAITDALRNRENTALGQIYKELNENQPSSAAVVQKKYKIPYEDEIIVSYKLAYIEDGIETQITKMSQLVAFKNGVNEMIEKSSLLSAPIRNALYKFKELLNLQIYALRLIYSDSIKTGEKLVPVTLKDAEGKDLLDEYGEPIYDVELKTVDEKSSTLKAINLLYEGQQELSVLRTWLSLNQGLRTNVLDILNFLYKLKQVGQSVSDEENPFSLEQYFSNASYRAEITDKYKDKMYAFNIFGAINALAHYNSYFRSLYILYKALRLSESFRVLQDSAFEDLRKGIGSLEQSTISEFLSLLLIQKINAYLESKFKNKTMKVFINEDEKIISKTIKLGNDVDNYFFVRFMNEVVIPSLKTKANSSEIDLRLNDFINSLLPTLLTKTPSKAFLPAYRLDAEAIPKTDNEILHMARITRGFLETQEKSFIIEADGKLLKYNLGELFWYYNLILYQNRTVQNSLTPVFTRSMGKTNYVSDYNKWMATSEVPLTYELNLLATFAPISNQTLAEAKQLLAYWEIDMDAHAFNLYRQIPVDVDNGDGTFSTVYEYELQNKRGTFSDEFGFTINFTIDRPIPAYIRRITYNNSGKPISLTVYKKGELKQLPITATQLLINGEFKYSVDIDLLLSMIEGELKSC